MTSHRWLRIWIASAAASAATLTVTASRVPDVRDAPRFPAALMAALARAGVEPNDFQTIAAGRAVAHTSPVTQADEVPLVGMVRIDVPVRFFEERYRDVASFEPPRRLLGAGMFSTPATPGNVQRLTLPPVDVSDLESCRPGHCKVHLDGVLLGALQNVDWDKAGAAAHAHQLLRGWAADYVNDYRRRGNAALFTYGHREPTRAHADDARALVEADGVLRAVAPRVAAYFQHLGAVGAPFPAEEFLYWSVIGLSRKSVTRINHVVIAPSTLEATPVGLIVSRTIFASHYLRDGLEVLVLVPAGEAVDGADRPSTYLVLSSRSHSDDLLGFRGVLLRGLVRRRARGSLERYLGDLKRRLESRYQGREDTQGFS